MSDEQQTEQAEQVEPVEEVSVGFIAEVKKAVTLGTTKDSVYTSFLDVLITEKKQQRAGFLRKAFEVLTKHASELNKIRPKSAGFDEKEVALPKIYAPEDMKKRKELKEKSQRLEAAIKKALDSTATENEWVALDNAIAKNS
jgi:hypothetical protein